MEKKLYIAGCLAALVCFCVMESPAHNSYTGGYSGAPGTSSCASSCHATTAGTLTVGGFPTTYVPGQTYTVTILHSGGSKIINVNATTRIGTTAAIAGIFGAGTNSALFTGTDGGVYAGTHLVDSVKFQWTAPISGTGAVNFYLAGMQGTTTGSKSGQSTKITLAATESTTGVESIEPLPKVFALFSNYPNPFNPSTTISYQVPAAKHILLRVYDAAGHEVATLVDGMKEAGFHSARFDASKLSSGIYFARLTFDGKQRTKKLVLMK